MPSLTCDRCGAAYEVAPGTARLHCASCGHTSVLKSQVVLVALAYQNRVRQEISRSSAPSSRHQKSAADTAASAAPQPNSAWEP